MDELLKRLKAGVADIEYKVSVWNGQGGLNN